MTRCGQGIGDTGDIAALSYARRINLLPVGVIAQAAGVASYPFLANLFAEGKLGEMADTVTRAVRTSLVVAGLATAGVRGPDGVHHHRRGAARARRPPQ